MQNRPNIDNKAKINKKIEINWGIPIPEKSANQLNP
jgi:hypothetical protein